MRRTRVLGLALALVLVVALGMMICSSPAVAADLVGEWENIARDGHHGALSGTPDHVVRPAGDHFASHEISWTLKITSQEGHGFHGQWCSSRKCEGLVGVIRRDGSMLMVDEDSSFLATMYGDEMELCVFEPGEAFRIVACNIMKKK